MSHRVQSLNALKVFEVAARHLSFKKAAAELFVTPAAVSHQLTQLESMLGVQLFVRLNQRIELTDAAIRALPKIKEGLASLHEALDLMDSVARGHTISIACSPSLAMRWLMPRLHRFSLAHPGIDVNVSTRIGPFIGRRGVTQQRNDLDAWVADADLALVYSDPLNAAEFPELYIERVLDLSITPLCSPRLLDGLIKEPADLLKVVRLHDNRGILYGNCSYWQRWLSAAGVNAATAEVDVGPRFSHALLALGAACDAMGVAVSTPALILPALRSGRLVMPFELVVPLETAYHLVASHATSARAEVQLFREWLHAESQQTQRDLARLLARPGDDLDLNLAIAAADPVPFDLDLLHEGLIP